MLKHVGRLVKNKRKVVVAYRTLPGDADSCLVVTTENLEAADHDFLMQLVESNSGQTVEEFAEAMSRSTLSDGSNMLARFHITGKLVKFPTKDVEMTPTVKTSINLHELNKIIADQKGVSIEDLAIKNPQANKQEKSNANSEIIESTPTDSAVLSDEQLAASYRSQADTMFKEAKRLREEAEKLLPTKKKTKQSEQN